MAYATVGDLIQAFREDEFDAVEPYLWPDVQLVRFANEALVAFAEQTKSIVDDSSAAAVIEYAADQQVLALHPSVIDVVEAYAGTRQLKVAAPGVVRRSELPAGGLPELLVLGSSAGQMKLYPAPQEAGTLELLVIRRPLAEVASNGAIPDVPTSDRRHLLSFMKGRSYSVQDVETYDPVKSAQLHAEFERACQGIYESALRRRSSASRGIRFRW